MLDLRGFCCQNADVAAKLLLLVKFVVILGDVAHEVPLDVKGFGGLLYFEGHDDAPLISEVLDDCFDGFFG